jgi:hypothetical protein
MTRMEWARSPVGYIAKYASKPYGGAGDDFQTKGARWWGAGGLSLLARGRLRLILAPAWVWRIAEAIDTDAVKRIAFGWWRIGAYEFRTPWEYLGLNTVGETMLKWRGWGEHDYELAGA